MVLLHVKCGGAGGGEWLAECRAADSNDAVIRRLVSEGGTRGAKWRSRITRVSVPHTSPPRHAALTRTRLAQCDAANARRAVGLVCGVAIALVDGAGGGDGDDEGHAEKATPPTHPPALATHLAHALRAAIATATATAADGPASVASGALASPEELWAAFAAVAAALREAVGPHGTHPRVAALLAGGAGMPEWEASHLGAERWDGGTAELWWAGKRCDRGATVADRAGRNDKTRLTATLQRAGGGPPPREPGVSDAERSAMMAWHFKRAEAEAALAADREDAHLRGGPGPGAGESRWADPAALRRSLQGTGGITWRPVAGGAGCLT